MTYSETLDWMFRQLPMYQQKGKTAFNGKLDNILRFATHLDHPHKKFKSIHVAGTNGKGSSSHMLASILQEAGYKVGLYTSPHLKDFRERICINGQTVGKSYVIDFIANNLDFLNANRLSFFEMTVGMAFAYFAESKVDIAIIEVGLGGRLDSTNIITPEVALITNIGYDHTDVLGDSLKKIALEKAGIIKPGIPVVISETQQEIQNVFKKVALERGAALEFADKIARKSYRTDLLGDYQVKNSRGVLAAIDKLTDFKISERDIKAGFENVTRNTGLMGRWQTIGNHPKIICDTAHNKEGLTLVLQQLLEQDFQTLHMVIGFVKEKDLTGVLPLMPTTANYYFCSPKVERGLAPTALREQANEFDLNGEVYPSVMDALETARNKASANDLIFVGGSNFTVAEVL
ncbi:bifunctional folylpolyglutamate synthase/dihydrofolate synthase [Aggregatimonas sangjinii]|uniref:Dihydrofolate synthase/folylpolyglutamate synthase n=1 Tax=Aggregatimonas sangjinii TaxID=2583587 RepID=A0A5B7SKB5_9FLAO|nr:folylpolyglutamate synthase/dihydrofolate synthase family protein [Aggregatimonas sangjinii]QCW98906.1 bifunctional folylpolyglutamate synthase/dihydrofolate synthase [Aggregatimonas sangjinii]